MLPIYTQVRVSHPSHFFPRLAATTSLSPDRPHPFSPDLDRDRALPPQPLALPLQHRRPPPSLSSAACRLRSGHECRHNGAPPLGSNPGRRHLPASVLSGPECHRRRPSSPATVARTHRSIKLRFEFGGGQQTRERTGCGRSIAKPRWRRQLASPSRSSPPSSCCCSSSRRHRRLPTRGWRRRASSHSPPPRCAASTTPPTTAGCSLTTASPSPHRCSGTVGISSPATSTRRSSARQVSNEFLRSLLLWR